MIGSHCQATCLHDVCRHSKSLVKYDPRSLIHGEQITVSLHTVMLVTVVLLIMVLEPKEMYSIWRGHVKLVLLHPVIHTAKGVLQDPMELVSALISPA